jgi:predicted metal-dependent phosphotriesterase family hydrolase
MSVSVERLTKAYLKIKAKRSELSAQFKEADEELSSQQDRIKKALLDYCKDQNVESVKTSEGTFYRSVRTKYWTSDWSSMYKFIIDNNLPEFFSKSLNQTNVKQFLEDNPEKVPAGLNVESEYVISVRKSK